VSIESFAGDGGGGGAPNPGYLGDVDGIGRLQGDQDKNTKASMAMDTEEEQKST
jgi:hypothetical protein